MKIIAGNKYLKKRENQIFFDLIPLDDILKLSKTPFMIFLENKIRDNIRSFSDTMTSVFPNFQDLFRISSGVDWVRTAASYDLSSD